VPRPIVLIVIPSPLYAINGVFPYQMNGTVVNQILPQILRYIAQVDYFYVKIYIA